MTLAKKRIFVDELVNDARQKLDHFAMLVETSGSSERLCLIWGERFFSESAISFPA